MTKKARTARGQPLQVKKPSEHVRFLRVCSLSYQPVFCCAASVGFAEVSDNGMGKI
jgi:hypothetical protein